MNVLILLCDTIAACIVRTICTYVHMLLNNEPCSDSTGTGQRTESDEGTLSGAEPARGTKCRQGVTPLTCHVCMYVRMYVRMYVCTYVCTDVYIG